MLARAYPCVYGSCRERGGAYGIRCVVATLFQQQPLGCLGHQLCPNVALVGLNHATITQSFTQSVPSLALEFEGSTHEPEQTIDEPRHKVLYLAYLATCRDRAQQFKRVTIGAPPLSVPFVPLPLMLGQSSLQR